MTALPLILFSVIVAAIPTACMHGVASGDRS